MVRIDVRLAAGDPAWDKLHGLLQAGFALFSRKDLSLREFMRETLRFPDGYIETAVSTVFLDGKPVDDIDAARVSDHSLVALSAAMPGLVGAVMRRNSPYASFRESITHGSPGGRAPDGMPGRDPGEEPGVAPSPKPDQCMVRVKLFNSVMRERGPDLLSRGMIVDAREAASALGVSRLALGETAADKASGDALCYGPDGTASGETSGTSTCGGGLVLLRVRVRLPGKD